MLIGTWNLENFFPPGGPSGPTTSAAYEAKLDGLATVIADLDPDVLAVQEVGDRQTLEDLATKLTTHSYTSLETADPDGRGIRVGFLSRLPLLDVHQIATFPAPLRPIQVDDTTAGEDAMGRPALVAGVVTRMGTRIELVTCHLKSKLLTFPGGAFSTRDEGLRARYGAYALYRRAAEAVTVRDAATGLLAGEGTERAVIVLGDLNDEPNAATTQILSGPPGSEIGTGGYDQPDQGDGARLWNLAARIPEADRYSRIYRGNRELIDHILVSHKVTHAVADGDVHAGPAPESINDNPNERRNSPASDHRPLVATIAL
ncbi:MAG: endonuclease [Pseudonocardia sp. SCN 72-86]|nr:MAG: endonuclease [Pseudonocardia sp. SCN 72-86]